MITAQIGGGRFFYRAAGVLIDSGRVLLHRATGDPNWVLPGERCEFMEESTDCLRREMREELGHEVRVVSLLWVVENFFRLDGVPCHEVGLYYLLELSGGSAPDQVPVRGWGDEIELEFRWFNPADLSGLPLVPPFLADRLGRLDPGIERGVDRRSLV